MTSDRQESDLSANVQKSGQRLNPNATTFYCATPLSSTYDDVVVVGMKSSVTGYLTNGDVDADNAEAGASLSPAITLDVDEFLDASALDMAFNQISPQANNCASKSTVECGRESLVTIVPHSLPVDGVSGNPKSNGSMPGHSDALSSFDGTSASGQATGATASTLNGSDRCVRAVTELGVFPNAPHQNGPRQRPVLSPSSSSPSSSNELRRLLLAQLEYYFSRANLVQDHYLQSQMDSDQYVQISTVANFNQVVKLTRNFDLIVDILKGSKHVQVDETGSKVRPRHNRSVLMLREIPDNAMKEEVEALFDDPKCPHAVTCEFAHNGYWYVTFNSDDDATSAFLHLQSVRFHGKPVCARIKAKQLVPLACVGAQYQANASVPPPVESPFLHTHPNQYPLMAHHLSSSYIGQHQIPQPVSPYPMYNYPTTAMLPQPWLPPANPTPAFLDPAAMLSMGGYQAAGIKPSPTGHSRMFPVRHQNVNIRGPNRLHHRPHLHPSDKISDPRPMDRGYSRGVPPLNRSSLHSVGQHDACRHPTPAPVSLSRSCSDGSGGAVSCANRVECLHISASDDAMKFSPVSEDDGRGSMLAASTRTESSMPVNQKRGSHFRRSRRGDDNARPSRTGGKEVKPMETQFELEPQSFPPLPGNMNNSSFNDTLDANKLSDVVRGGGGIFLKDFTAACDESSLTGQSSTDIITGRCHDYDLARACTAADSCSTFLSLPHTAMPDMRPGDGGGVYVNNVASKLSPPVTVPETSCLYPLLHHSLQTTHPETAISVVATAKAMVCCEPDAPKLTTVGTVHGMAPADDVSPVVSTPLSVDTLPARLSYAQMVLKKQQQNVDGVRDASVEGVMSATCPADHHPTPHMTAPPEQCQHHALGPGGARRAGANPRVDVRDGGRREFDPREQRYPVNGRRANDNRDGRQFRCDRRQRVDMHSKLSAN